MQFLEFWGRYKINDNWAVDTPEQNLKQFDAIVTWFFL